MRDLAVGPADRLRETAQFEPHPVLAVLATRRDDQVGWLTGGQALQRVLLTATDWGLSASFLNQALDSDRLRALATAALGGEWHAQMLMRLGCGKPPDATPRRPLSDVTTESSDS